MTAQAALVDRDGTRTAELVLSKWFVVSPYGVGNDPFADGVLSGRSAISGVDRSQFDVPYELVGLVPDFSAAKYLGNKGTRLMDRLTALAVTAAGGLVDQCREDLVADPERAALVLGTGWASVQSIMDTTRDSLTGDKPYHVDPAKFPNTVMNKAAGQSAIWHTIKGPNTTISGDWLTALLTLSYAARLVRGGHCDRALCGVAEEYSAQRAWLEWHAGRAGGDGMSALGEGSAFFLLESAADAERSGRTPLVRLLATRFTAFGADGDAGAALRDCVRAALRHAGVGPEQVRVVAPAGAGAAPVENDVLTGEFGASAPEWIRSRHLIGDASAASAGFQIAAVLAAAGRKPLARDEAAVVTTIGRDGMTGCLVLGGCGGSS
ncbi:beta-ketoacyl synthase N-terminal-like domain-containing protein [Lentzea sp. E54]|uniref:beta-ketoacyl synthase N-terminal-like domain-containing protein n=1 Tax=Lentzea xerophila TaxID=3435883 RepID=UPI003DA5C04F